jgi:hypothetical protein
VSQANRICGSAEDHEWAVAHTLWVPVCVSAAVPPRSVPSTGDCLHSQRSLALLAGAIGVVGAVYTARTFALNRVGQLTDRFTKAIEQLGHQELDVRLGGIYALERIARDSEKDHPQVMEVLTGYIREHARREDTPNALCASTTIDPTMYAATLATTATPTSEIAGSRS